MKNVRVFYKKFGTLRFVSHLDMYRLVIRLLRRANLPMWQTEGYNKRPYVTFALPLSLGFTSNYESFDFKLLDDDMTFDEVTCRISEVSPLGFEVIKAGEPVMKAGKITCAEFEVTFDCNKILQNLDNFFKLDSIMTEKVSKSGKVRQIDIAEKIIRHSVSENEGKTVAKILLPAGGGDNINPNVVIEAFLKAENISADYTVCRTMLFTDNKKMFI